MDYDPYVHGYRLNLATCPRCGEEHADVLFSPLLNPVDDWWFWAECRNTGQPVLGSIVPEPETASAG